MSQPTILLDLLPVLQAALALGLGGVFVASALPKLRHPRGFVLSVLEYRILPTRPSWIVGRLLPPLELLVALLLLTGTLVMIAAGIAMGLLLCFVAAVGLNLMRGRRMDCACFGDKRRRAIGARVLLEDAVMLAASALLVVLPGGSEYARWSLWRLMPLAGGSRIEIGVAVLLLGGVVSVLALMLHPAIMRRAWQMAGNRSTRGVMASGTGRRNVTVKG